MNRLIGKDQSTMETRATEKDKISLRREEGIFSLLTGFFVACRSTNLERC